MWVEWMRRQGVTENPCQCRRHQASLRRHGFGTPQVSLCSSLGLGDVEMITRLEMQDPLSAGLFHRLLITLAVVGCLCLWPRTSQAQVNAEQFRALNVDQGWSGQIRGDISWLTGNVTWLDLSSTGALRFHDDPIAGPKSVPAHRWLLIANARLVRSDDERIINRGLGHTRWTWMWTRYLGLDLFAQVQFDQFQRLRLRVVSGGNLRLEFVRTPRALIAMGSGYMPEYESFNEGAPRCATNAQDFDCLNHRWNNYLTGNVTIIENVLDFTHTSYVQPRFNDFSDVHMLHSSGWDIHITKHLNLTTRLEVQHDTTPPPEVVRTDTRFSQGVELVF